MSFVNSQKTHLFVAAEKYKSDLGAEIEFRKNLKLIHSEGNLFWAQGPRVELWWPQWQLWDIQEAKIESISQGSKLLRSKGKYWLSLDYKLHRRCALIQDGLPKFRPTEIKRGHLPQIAPCGAWFLKDPNTICFTNEVSVPFANGIIPIPEDKKAPSRAFRKLDEVFVRTGKAPSKIEKVIDLGSHPGGWTWVLSIHAGQVISVDTVPLDFKLNSASNVRFIKKDAFKLSPNEIGKVDWLFSDIICEPIRLFNLINEWRDLKMVKNFVCTIKFKGQVDFEILSRFQKIPNSKIFHLNANKHELTWVCLE